MLKSPQLPLGSPRLPLPFAHGFSRQRDSLHYTSVHERKVQEGEFSFQTEIFFENQARSQKQRRGKISLLHLNSFTLLHLSVNGAFSPFLDPETDAAAGTMNVIRTLMHYIE